MTVAARELERYLNELLAVEQFSSDSPNGLQIEGKVTIRKLVTGICASQVLFEQAALSGADAVLVYHGLFQNGGDKKLSGARRRRFAYALAQDFNVYAYRLPLDAHAEYGSNTQLAKVLKFKQLGVIDRLLFHGELPVPLALAALGQHVGRKLQRWSLLIGEPKQQIRRIAWCAGAAQDFFEQAIEAGVDAYLSGEISERHVHLARESKVAFIAAGHHATERYGIQALGEHIAERFAIEHQFIEVESPV